MLLSLRKILYRHLVCFIIGYSFFIILVLTWFTLDYCLKPKVLWDSYGIIYVLENNSNETIKDIKIKFQGGEYTLDFIPAISKKYFIVNYFGESKMKVSFVDVSNHQHEDEIEEYIEPGYKGTFEFFIDKNFKLTWKNNTEPFPVISF